MELTYLDYLSPTDLPVPQDRPFGFAEAIKCGLTPHLLRVLVGKGLITTPLRGVYHLATLRDDLQLRLDCLRIVAPVDAVVCDRAAGWLHGAPMILAPGSHLEVPRATLIRSPGYRWSNALGGGGERMLSADDVVLIDGLLVTSPLRTACDLGRLLHRDQGLAALDSMLRLGDFGAADLEREVERFRGFRHVRQLRELAPLADRRAESPPESILRLRWLDCGDLPRPHLQVSVRGPWGEYLGDLGVPDLGYIAEYDGEEFHGPDQAEHDRVRRANMSTEWEVDVFRSENIFGPRQDAELRLRAGVRRAIERRRQGWAV